MTTTNTTTRPTADQLNGYLSAGRAVRVCTHLRITEYKSKHAGIFFEGKDGCLRVKSGKRSLCLSFGVNLLVAIRISQ